MLKPSLMSLRRGRSHRARLANLNYISNIASQSLELKQILNSSINGIVEIMDADVALIFLLNQEAHELILHAHIGVSDTFLGSVDRLKLGNCLNGMVAETGEPAFVKDATTDNKLTMLAVKEEKLHSLIIVPLKSKDKVLGTICVATHDRRQFNKVDMALLAALGKQIGIAVENAQLYEEGQRIIEQLRASEEQYRTLFQNAHDAIWVHDMDGNIVSANVAAAGLTGYGLEELCRMNVKSFLSEGSLRLAKEVRSRLLNKRAVSQPYEQKLITKDGVEAILKLTTGVVEVNGVAVGFQHIARDVTEEKRMQESLRFYLDQITMAQEEERKRISRELHDDTIQALVVLARQLDDVISASNDLPFDKRRLLDNLRKQANDIMADLRRLSQDLRPPALDRLGLLPALEWLASDISRGSGMNIEVTMRGVSRRFSANMELVLFRVAQEALRNALRHSHASNAYVSVEFGEKLVKIIVADNGRGFSPPETTGGFVKLGRLGLAGMQERIQLIGGNLKINSKPGAGTTITIEAPL
jgi:PAS domain S-box-containing protein